MGDLIEFYVSCNPPLLPKGVKYVLDQLKESKIGCIEILYEPTIPWFQCTVSKRRKDALANFLTSLIHDILARETGDFELDVEAGDIEIIAEDPMIISWGAFLQLKEEDLVGYEPYRYPDSFRRFAFKTIWQGLRSIGAPEWLNTKGLLQREGDFDWSIKAFKGLVGCEVSFNIQDDILYLGSNDRASIDKAVRRLDSLFQYRKHAAPPPTHLILPPDDPSEWKLSLRPISKFRLATSTIIQTNAVNVKDDYESLYSKGIISTYVFEARYGEEWGLPEFPLTDQTRLPREPFVDFVNYTYPAKQATGGPSVRPSVAEHPLPKAISQRAAAIVADWVRKTGEADGSRNDDLQSPGLQPPDGASASGTHQLQDLGSTAESSQVRGRYGTTVRNIMDEDSPSLGVEQHVDIEGHGLRNESVQQESFQKRSALSSLLGTTAQGITRPADDSPLESAGTSTLTPSTTALADLVGLSIPITTNVGVPSGSAQHATHEHSTQPPNMKASGNGYDVQREGRNVSYTKDLLGTDNDDDLQNLMAPMIPTSAPQSGFGAAAPQREYRQTMNQRAPRRERDRVPQHPNAAERLSPSPPPSVQRRSKIPVKSQPPTPSVRGSQLKTTQSTPGPGTGSPGPTKVNAAARGSRLRGTWNTGLGGDSFGHVGLTPELQDSVKMRIDFKRALEGCFERMLRRARVLPGKVSMEIVFCRIVIENVSEAVVNYGRVDQYDQKFAPLRLLNELATFNEGDFRWHGTLSLNGGDANMLKEINWTSDANRKWQKHATEVFYDFGCEDITNNCRFIIQVNAADFTHSFESQKFALEDLVFIHCPDRSWDLNACVKATDTAYFKDQYDGFAKSLIESLAVPEGLSCGNPRFSFREHGEYRVSVERVRVRHVARYRDGQGGNTFLNITMWQATNMDWDVVEESSRSTRDIRVEPSENDDTKGVANVWYEASISSARAEKVFQENAGIEFGEEVQWKETELRSEGVFKDLYLPAIGMVEKMDRIGAGNNNGRNPFDGDVLTGSDARIGDLKEKQYW